jgi:hypothetical protein
MTRLLTAVGVAEMLALPSYRLMAARRYAGRGDNRPRLVGPDRVCSAATRLRRTARSTLMGVPGRAAACDSTSRSMSRCCSCTSMLDFSAVADSLKPASGRGELARTCNPLNERAGEDPAAAGFRRPGCASKSTALASVTGLSGSPA